MLNSNRFIVALLTCAAIVTLRHTTIAQEKAPTMSAPTILDFGEFKDGTTADWNDRRYGSHEPNTPAIITELLTPKGGLDIRLELKDETADFNYPVCVLSCQPYPDPDSRDVRKDPFTQFIRLQRDDAVDANALTVFDSFDLLSNPGTGQAPGVRLWLEDSRQQVVWGPIIISPWQADNGRIWHQEIPTAIKADKKMTLWIQDLDAHNVVNLKDGYWSIDNIKFRQVTPEENEQRGGYQLAEVGKKVYQSYQGEENRGAPNPTRFEIAHLPSNQQVVFAVSATDRRYHLEGLTATCSITEKDSDKPIVVGEIPAFEEPVMAAILDVAKCKPGEYFVSAQFLKDGKPIENHSEGLVIEPRPEWWDNKIGILPDDQVPIPWTNLITNTKGAAETALSCWNRTYHYQDSLLPAQVSTAGADMLHQPIQMRAVVAGTDAGTIGTALQITKETNARIELTTTGQLGSIAAQTDTWLEYDGFMWVKFTLTPEAPTKLANLRLEIPIKREYATLYNSDREDDRAGTGAIDDIGEEFFTRFDQIWNRAVVCWAGDGARGIHWCTESNQNWSLNDPHRGIGYIRTDDTVTITINLIDHEVTLSEPITYEFGLMATPTQPKPKGWRDWRIGYGDDPGVGGKFKDRGATKYGPDGVNYAYFQYWSKYTMSRYPEGTPRAKERIKILEKQGVRALPDCACVWGNPHGPEYLYHQAEWHPMPFSLPDIERMNPEKDWLEYPMCPNNKSYVDWWIWAADRMVKDLDLTAMYFDMSMPSVCGSHWHGCGFQDSDRGWPPLNSYFNTGYGPALPYRRLIDEIGHYHPETKILATRELFKRFYVLAKQRDPNYMIVYHTSGDYYCGINSFASYLYLGEDLRRPPVNYYEKLTLPLFRAAYMGHAYGPLGLFLPEFSPVAHSLKQDRQFWYTDEAIKQIRQLIGLLLVHDTQVVAAFSGMQAYNEMNAALDEFGHWNDGLEFLPYWNNQALVGVTPTNDNLVASMFRNGQHAMLVLFNNTDNDIETQVRIDCDALGITGDTLYDPTAKASFAIDEDTAAVAMPYRDYRVLILR